MYIQLERLKNRLAGRKIGVILDNDALKYIASMGFDPSYGARPVKRAIQNFIQNPMAKEMLAGNITEGDTIKVEKKDSGLEFSVI